MVIFFLSVEPLCRRVPDHVSVSRIAYFKRKFVEDDDDPPFSFRTYCQTVILEERAHVLRLSLEKMRFIDDPEAFLRRSVLVNNLLRRLRAEILLQSTDWCFPPNPAFTTAPQAGPPLRKRFRMVRGGQGDLRPECAQTCCCIYAAAAAAAAGHYLHLPFSMYDAALSTCPSTPHSSSFFQLASHSKLGLSVAVEDHDDEDEDGHIHTITRPCLVGQHLCMRSRNGTTQRCFPAHGNCCVHLNPMHTPLCHVHRFGK
uniref:SERTA domain containing 4 n=1 Tax=Sphaeramia orbicularis TaxID=375764 RepID=A0A673C509_9TELE